MAIETAVRQASGFHEVRNADTVEASLAEELSRHLDDTLSIFGRLLSTYLHGFLRPPKGLDYYITLDIYLSSITQGTRDMSTNLGQQFGLVPPDQAIRLTGLEFLRGLMDGTLPAPPFAEVSDLRALEVDVGRIVFEALPSKKFYNPMGVVHGGWLALVLDTVMGCAVHSTLEAGQTYTTVEMKTNFVKAVRENTGKLRCEGVLLHAGARIAGSEGKIFNSAGDLVAHGSETCLISSGGHR